MRANHRNDRYPLLALAGAIVAGLTALPALAQDRGGDDAQTLQAIEVTGSRIKKAEVEGQTPILTITSQDIEATGGERARSRLH